MKSLAARNQEQSPKICFKCCWWLTVFPTTGCLADMVTGWLLGKPRSQELTVQGPAPQMPDSMWFHQNLRNNPQSQIWLFPVYKEENWGLERLLSHTNLAEWDLNYVWLIPKSTQRKVAVPTEAARSSLFKVKKKAIVLCSCTADNNMDHAMMIIIFKTNILKPFLSYLMKIAWNSL